MARSTAHRCLLLLGTVAVSLLAACDGYIEEARVERDGSVEFVAQATVACNDPLQQAIWGENPCDQIDTIIRTGEVGELPFDFELDPNRVSLVGTGEADRRTIDVSWNGTIEEVSTVLVSSGSIRVIDDVRTEVVFVSEGAPADLVANSTDADIVDELRTSRWSPAEFRIKTPDLVVEHNGDDIQGRLVIWELDTNQPEEFRVVWTTEDPPRRLWWWIIGSAVLLGVLVLMITIEGPAQERRAHARRAKATDPTQTADDGPSGGGNSS